ISSVNIPFKENKIFEQVIHSEYYSALLSDIEEEKDKIVNYDAFIENPYIKRGFERIFKDITNFTPEEIMETIYKNIIEESDEYDNMTDMEFRRKEYNVLSGKEDFDKDNNRLNLNIISKDLYK